MLEGTSSSPTPAKAGPPRAGHTGTYPGRFGMSPERETPQRPWAACASALPPSHKEVLHHVELTLVVVQFLDVNVT